MFSFLHSKFFTQLSTFLPFIAFQKAANEEHYLIVTNKNLLTVTTILKKHFGLQYNILSCISGVDLLKSDYRYMIVYDFLSTFFNNRLKLKVFCTENPIATSITSIYQCANWWEREIWDLFGIYFQNHPNLRRILTDYGFEGYPLRKDFPLTGFYELHYDINKKSIISKELILTQAFRSFNINMNYY